MLWQVAFAYHRMQSATCYKRKHQYRAILPAKIIVQYEGKCLESDIEWDSTPDIRTWHRPFKIVLRSFSDQKYTDFKTYEGMYMLDRTTSRHSNMEIKNHDEWSKLDSLLLFYKHFVAKILLQLLICSIKLNVQLICSKFWSRFLRKQIKPLHISAYHNLSKMIESSCTVSAT